MTNRDLVAGVFVTEWAQLATSPVMGRALRRWRAESNGLITATSHVELLAVIKDPSEASTSMRVASWLLATADPMAIRILVQAAQPFVMATIRKANPRHDETTDFANTCVTSLYLAAESMAGTHHDWVIWTLRWRYFREVGKIPLGREPMALQSMAHRKGKVARYQPQMAAIADLDRLESFDDPRADIELGRLLVAAVNAGNLDLADAQMLWLHTIGGVTLDELSAERGIKVQSIRKHRARVLRRVSAYAESLVA